MIALVKDKREEMVALCQQYGIRKLEVFGSAATGVFNPGTSDLDFVVDVGEYERGVGMRFLTFCTALEKLMDRPVDVITNRQIQNPYFRASVNATRESIYDASDSEAVA